MNNEFVLWTAFWFVLGMTAGSALAWIGTNYTLVPRSELHTCADLSDTTLEAMEGPGSRAASE